MRTPTAFAFVTVLLLLAVMPWAISSCAQQPLLPDDLRERPTRYQMTVDTSQNATREAERAATSAPPKIVPLGTVAVTPESGIPASPTESPTATLVATGPTIAPTLPISAAVSLTPGVESSTIVVVGTTVITNTPEATPRVLVIRSTSGVADATNTPTITPTLAPSTPITGTQAITGSLPVATATPVPPVVVAPPPVGPPTPSGMVDVEDVLTQEMLAAQMTKDAEGTDLSELTVALDRNGVSATGIVRIFPAFRRPITATGNFAVENESLVVKIAQILFNGRDVTEEHRAELESNVNSSLYRLLPQRYVQSFEMEDGQVIVRSKMRP